jgi:hypothetical protein
MLKDIGIIKDERMLIMCNIMGKNILDNWW